MQLVFYFIFISSVTCHHYDLLYIGVSITSNYLTNEFGSNDTSSFHKNGLECYVVGSKPTRCVSYQVKIYIEIDIILLYSTSF